MMGLILCQRPEEALICCVTCSSLMVQKLCHVFTDSWSPSSIARFAFIRGFSPDLTNKRPYLSAIPTSIQSILNTHSQCITLKNTTKMCSSLLVIHNHDHEEQ